MDLLLRPEQRGSPLHVEVVEPGADVLKMALVPDQTPRDRICDALRTALHSEVVADHVHDADLPARSAVGARRRFGELARR